MTLKRLLVATDFSPAAGQALSMAAELARRFGATLQVVHVIDDVALMVAPGIPTSIWADCRRR